jgi:hypothetical protein
VTAAQSIRASTTTRLIGISLPPFVGLARDRMVEVAIEQGMTGC